MIIWKSDTVSPRCASFRYRTALPALYLEKLGHRIKFLWHTHLLQLSPSIEAVVFSEAFDLEDLALARRARNLGIPIICDLREDVFAAGPVKARVIFEQIGALASVIVTTNNALAGLISTRLGRSVRIAVIPDPVESANDTELILRRFRLAENLENFRRAIAVQSAASTVWSKVARSVRTSPRKLLEANRYLVWIRRIAESLRLREVLPEHKASVAAGSRPTSPRHPFPGQRGDPSPNQPKVVTAHADEIAEERYDPARVAECWSDAIRGAARTKQRALPSDATRIVFLVNLIQDLELVLPMHRKALHRAEWRPELWVTGSDLFRWPEMIKRLDREKVPFELVEPKLASRGGLPDWSGVAALITASESNLPPHARAHDTVRLAKAHGVRTFTLQHGFENVGLTYTDSEFPIAKVQFASDTIFLWGLPDSLHPDVPASTRAKCVAVGCPKAFDTPKVGLPVEFRRPMIAVFENLHWSRYSHDYRSQFLADFLHVSETNPQLQFVIKPHPAGAWLTARYGGVVTLPENVMIADPRSPQWACVSAVDLVQHSLAAISTPSTVALDAAILGKPVAVVAYSLDIQAYRLLPAIRSRTQWAAFVSASTGETTRRELIERSRSFADHALVEGDAAQRILDHIAACASERGSPSSVPVAEPK